MAGIVHINGIIGSEENEVGLVDVIRQVNSFEDESEYLFKINSIGGLVDEGNDIYNYMQTLKEEGKIVNTYTTRAYSIAAKIFAGGDEKQVPAGAKDVIMIHNPWIENTSGGAAELEEAASYLRLLEGEFQSFYAEETGQAEETIDSLLTAETYLSSEEAIDLKFATVEVESVQAKAMAKLNMLNMKVEKKEKKEKEKAGKLLAQVFSMLGLDGLVKSELTLQDSTAQEIVFPDLMAGDTPSVGDKAEIDGSAISDGTYIMPSLDNISLVFVGGEVTEVIEAEEEEEVTEALQARYAGGLVVALEDVDLEASEVEGDTITKLVVKNTAKLESVVASGAKEITTYDIAITNDSAEEGDTLMYMNWQEEEVAVWAGEFILSSGQRVVTDASGVVVEVKEKDAEPILEGETEASAMLEQITNKVTETIKAELQADFEAKIAAKEQEIVALKSKVKGQEPSPSPATKTKVASPKGAARYAQAARELNKK